MSSLTMVKRQGAGCTLAEEWEGWFRSGRPCCSHSSLVCLVKYHEGFDPQQGYFWAGLQLEPYSGQNKVHHQIGKNKYGTVVEDFCEKTQGRNIKYS